MLGDRKIMKTGLMIGGVLLFIVAIIGHSTTPYIISQLDNFAMPLQGNILCSNHKDMQTDQSPVAEISTMNQYLHENICLLISTTQIILLVSTLVVGIIGILIIIYGGLAKGNKEKKLVT
jgi:hypothetical protein